MSGVPASGADQGTGAGSGAGVGPGAGVGLPRRVVVLAPGKINLSLAVGAVDARGYHVLETLFHAVDLAETVTVVPADELSLTVDSAVPGEIPLDGRNLALRAAEQLRAEHDVSVGAELHIRKEVPVAGGMGGGSADAAATLVALDRLWGLGLSEAQLRAHAARLGADVPFALRGRTALGRGNGGDLSSVLTAMHPTWLLAVPGGHLSTPEVYRRHDEIAAARGRTLTPEPRIDPRQLEALASGDLELLGRTLHNDLQDAALALHPGLEPVLAAALREGALGALVSGSGPTIAVLVADQAQARGVAAALQSAGLVESCLIAEGNAPGARVLEES
ncbi:4-(cytidine 5'-diphospho)-2-C-methyl-D-erythritol kinase [Brachybacterium sp. J144]|uniref:4-(cytidine 5'-diphospho)-2-C-methyl-D-erythritol kinase n=1 Tax=Brachybacterium sp. J144 TaxID=3116487 RepID=UPI002E788023|nr:4-(cytidine 5'-diphospho)-2-C-methyl-D-erythritol kinase [Brachybacterium sp. J144]MEE1649484.1 4-(cytidine 5'-diphospho)-2-C-methyl-D-erythritol kinase [Brachybacterium sp. J144]